jgi:DNA-binding NtrC family response regulator
MSRGADAVLAGVKILLIEDTASLRMVYRSVLIHAGAEVRAAAGAAEARTLFRDRPVPLVILDLTLPDGDGIDLMQELRGLRHDVRFVVVTAHGGVGRAVQAMRAGAHDFLVKPFDAERLVTACRSAAQSLGAPGRRPRALSEGLGAMVGASPAMTGVAAAIASAAATMAPVLIAGAPGTGKDLCARMLHALSGRASGPFVRINCQGASQAALERALFSDDGIFFAAREATLYLANLPAMPLPMQARLLPMLHPVGSALDEGRRPSGRVRMVAGITGTLTQVLRDGALDPQLFGLLTTVRIDLPPLRDRGRDVIEIANAALAQFGAETGTRLEGLSAPVEALLLALPWPANVRELLNLIRQIVLVGRTSETGGPSGGLVTLDMLPERIVPIPLRGLTSAAPSPWPAPAAPAAAPGAAIPRQAAIAALQGMTLAQIERAVIEAAIAAADGSLPRAAKALGLAPSTLYRKREGWAEAAD